MNEIYDTMDILSNKMDKLNLKDNVKDKIKHNVKDIIKLQALWRGFICRKKRLPNILYYVQKSLQNITINLNESTKDGRVNSSLDEQIVINFLSKNYKCKIPPERWWYDILLYDFYYGWLPINIKTTTTNSSDNAGNMAICVHAYTDNILQLEDKTYNNGAMSKLLIDKINNKQYNRKLGKDYYFIVVNKNNTKEIIINSLLGLSKLTPNLNNLPFQICWKNNKKYEYKFINDRIKEFLFTLQSPKPTWKESFIENIRKIKI
jgi:hypothetical protein